MENSVNNMLQAQFADADPVVMALFATLQQFDCSEERKIAALACAMELCRTFYAVVEELDQTGEVAVTQTGMVRLSRLSR
jgi:hypothetical protein